MHMTRPSQHGSTIEPCNLTFQVGTPHASLNSIINVWQAQGSPGAEQCADFRQLLR